HLHDWVKRKTADFRQLSADTVHGAPFSSLAVLSNLVEERLNQPSLLAGLEDRRAWLTAFGTQLGRIELADPAETDRVRALGGTIAATSWVQAPKLEVIPYLDGVPAGTARLTDLLWLDRRLFVSPLTKAKLAKRVPEEIGRSLSTDIRAALAYAFERSPEDIKEYLEENFTLGPEGQAVVPVVEPRSEPTPIDDDLADEPSEDAHEDVAPAGAADDLHLSEDDEPTPPSESEPQAAVPDPGLIDSEVATKPRPAPKPPRPSVMVRFALAQGYKADGEDRFFHADGSWIGRANGTRFPWERRSASGEVLRHYYPKEQCLEREPLQIEAEDWGLLDQKPDIYSFILVNPEGEPVEMTGARLRALREGGEITIHPATYRLVYDLDK
ncbi:MAG TPA: hypothetical protein V6D47_20510, partial [Oscillatoriaceae cyanobacterium]